MPESETQLSRREVALASYINESFEMMARGLQRDVVDISWVTNMCPNGGGSFGVSANDYSCIQEPKLTLETYIHMVMVIPHSL
jgi:hypothetical protein